MRGGHRLLAGLLAAGAILTATGCAQSVNPIERLGRKAAQRVHHPSPTPAAGPPACGGHRGPGALAVIPCRRPPESRQAPRHQDLYRAAP